MLKLLHAADLHLDAPLTGLVRAVGGELGRRASRCTLDAFTRVVDLALREQVDGVLLAGDLFERRERSLRARLHLLGELERLDAAGIPAFLVAGNHDPLLADEASVPLPPSAVRFGPDWSEVLVERPAGRYRVQGVSYPRAEVRENLARAFRRQGPEPTVGLLHANVGARSGHQDYAPCTPDDLAAAALDYWALGHVHTREQFAVGRGLAAYPGNPQGRHARETGPRGCLLVALDPEGRVPPSTRFLATDVLRWHALEVDLGAVEALEAIPGEVLDQVGRALEGGGEAEAHVVRVTLTGATAVHQALRSPEAGATLEETLAEGGEGRGWILESLEVATSAGWSLPAVLASGGLPAEVARLLERPPGAPELSALWASAGLDPLEARLARLGLPPLDRNALLPAAVAQALDLMLEEPP